MLALFILGSLWFWILAALWFVATFVSLGFEHHGWATLFTVVAIGLIGLSNQEALMSLGQNPGIVLAIAGIYVAIGIAWSFAKWVMKVSDAYKIKLKAEEHVKAHPESWQHWPGETDEEKMKREVKIQLVGNFSGGARPEAKNCKSQITSWMAYWPISLINFLIFDALRRFFRFLYEKLLDAYNAITVKFYPET